MDRCYIQLLKWIQKFCKERDLGCHATGDGHVSSACSVAVAEISMQWGKPVSKIHTIKSQNKLLTGIPSQGNVEHEGFIFFILYAFSKGVKLFFTLNFLLKIFVCDKYGCFVFKIVEYCIRNYL
jgi:hypothetical protein